VDSNFTVIWPEVKDTFGGFELLEYSDLLIEKKGAKTAKERTYTLTSFDTGSHIIEPFGFLVRRDESEDSLFTESILIDVTTVEIDPSGETRDIKSPMYVPFSIKPYLPYIIGGVIILALIVLIATYLQKRLIYEKKPEKEIPQILPHVHALEELNKLDKEQLWQNEKLKEYYSRLTDITREYIETRFGIFAIESTSDEIIQEVEQLGIRSALIENLSALLIDADLIKFAKGTTRPEDNVRHYQNARNFVERTAQSEEDDVKTEIGI